MVATKQTTSSYPPDCYSCNTIIQAGDTLSELGEQCGLTPVEVQTLNPEHYQDGYNVVGQPKKKDGGLIYPGESVNLNPLSLVALDGDSVVIQQTEDTQTETSSTQTSSIIYKDGVAVDATMSEGSATYLTHNSALWTQHISMGHSGGEGETTIVSGTGDNVLESAGIMQVSWEGEFGPDGGATRGTDTELSIGVYSGLNSEALTGMTRSMDWFEISDASGTVSTRLGSGISVLAGEYSETTNDGVTRTFRTEGSMDLQSIAVFKGQECQMVYAENGDMISYDGTDILDSHQVVLSTVNNVGLNEASSTGATTTIQQGHYHEMRLNCEDPNMTLDDPSCILQQSTENVEVSVETNSTPVNPD